MNKEERLAEKKRMLNAPMDEKLIRTKMLIMDWYHQFEGDVYVAFSGGKDSTVLLHIVRSLFPDVPAVFADTGLEFPEIKQFVKTIDNTVTLKPKKSFKTVLETMGYPVVSKEQSQYLMQLQSAAELYGETDGEKGSLKTIDTRWNGNKWGRGKISEKWKFLLGANFKITDKCCDVFKKEPFRRYEKETGRKGFVGVMAGESAQRAVYYYKSECNAFHAKRPISKPLFFWNEGDIYKYIRDFDIDISSIYDKGYKRTGCIFCMFGTHLNPQEEDRFTRLAKTHPKLYDYCMDKLNLRKVLKLYTGRDYK